MSAGWDGALDWLRTSPLFLVTLTVVVYALGCRLRDRSGGHPLAQPVLVGVVVVGAVVVALDVDVAAYVDATQVVSFFLGPATVALAVPLHRQWHRLRAVVVPLLVAVLVGAVVSVTSASLVARALGADELLQRTLAPKATTAPVAIALSETLGGIAPLSAALAIVAGTLGAVAGPHLMTWLRLRDPRVRGVALGSVSHGIGTARLLHDSEVEGAFCGLAMGLTALATSLVLPVLAALLF
ncbi:MAG: hypothetical protein CMH83_00750 [Nocardioides sp.]|nr:hypothetical protein [Nocardioides sp.]